MIDDQVEAALILESELEALAQKRARSRGEEALTGVDDEIAGMVLREAGHAVHHGATKTVRTIRPERSMWDVLRQRSPILALALEDSESIAYAVQKFVVSVSQFAIVRGTAQGRIGVRRCRPAGDQFRAEFYLSDERGALQPWRPLEPEATMWTVISRNGRRYADVLEHNPGVLDGVRELVEALGRFADAKPVPRDRVCLGRCATTFEGQFRGEFVLR